MNPFMKGVKLIIRKIVKDAIRSLFQYNLTDKDLLRVALVCYRDHPPESKSSVTFTNDFTSNTTEFKELVKSISAIGGGDECEAVLDGLNEVVNNLTWRKNSEKFCFHLLDAPPHGSEFNGNKDNYPEGCTCGLEYITLLSDLRELEVDYTIIKLNNSINKMIEVFSNYIEVDVLTIELEPDKNKSTDQSG